MALTCLETHQDLSPASPQVITDSFAINCTDTAVRYKINPDIPHAFLVRTAADITVKDASGNALTKDDDFYLRQTKRDAYYSKEYSLSSIFSEIQFSAVGSYTITRHLCVGTYITASWLNSIKSQIKEWLVTVIPSIQESLSQLLEIVNGLATRLADHDSRITVLESNPTIIVVADHATMEALTGLKTGTTVYVVADTDGKRAEYLYDGTAFQKTSDPDWENINIDWSALLNIPTGVAALVAGTLASTALADMPTPADADDTKVLSWDKTTGKYKLLTVSAAAGVGDVAGPSSAVSGHIPLFSGTTGKIIEDSGVAPSDLYASACATQEVTTADVTIADVKKGTLILTGALTGNRIVYLPAAVWRKTIICNCTGSYYVRVLAIGQSAGGVYQAPGDVAEVYCDGVNIVKLPGWGKPHTISAARSTVKALAAGVHTPITDWTITNNYLGQQGAQYFTALQACVVTVYVSAATTSGTAGGEFMAYPYVNDNRVFAMRTTVDGSYGASLSGSYRVALAAGDKLDVRFASLSATDLTASSYVHLLIE